MRSCALADADTAARAVVAAHKEAEVARLRANVEVEAAQLASSLRAERLQAVEAEVDAEVAAASKAARDKHIRALEAQVEAEASATLERERTERLAAVRREVEAAEAARAEEEARRVEAEEHKRAWDTVNSWRDPSLIEGAAASRRRLRQIVSVLVTRHEVDLEGCAGHRVGCADLRALAVLA